MTNEIDGPAEPAEKDDSVDRMWRKRERLWKRDQGVCRLCGKPIDHRDIHDSDRVNIDHIRPKSHGGGNHFGNLQLTHVACNTLKGDSCSGCPGCVRKDLSRYNIEVVLIDVNTQMIRSARQAIWRKNAHRCCACRKPLLPSDVLDPLRSVVISESIRHRARFSMVHAECVDLYRDQCEAADGGNKDGSATSG